MVVIDASAAVALITNQLPQAPRLRLRLAGTEGMHAPHLLDVEVLHVLRRQVFRGDVSEATAALAVGTLSQMRLTRYSHELLRGRIWELRGNLTAYDAAYVALAEALDIPLLTLDGPLFRAPGHSARVEHIA